MPFNSYPLELWTLDRSEELFFDNKKSMMIIDDFIENLPNQDNLKIEAFTNLIKKFKDKNSSLRLGFRENMAFIIGLSDHFLNKSAKNWSKFNSTNNEKIKYVYYK